MKNFNIIRELLIVIVLILPFAVSAKKPVNPPSASRTLSGVVTDKMTREHLSGAYLYFDKLGKGVYSGADGKFNLDGIEPGDYNVTVKYISYHDKQVSLKVKKSKKNQKTIQLDPVQP
jgi:hypothetical protein